MHELLKIARQKEVIMKLKITRNQKAQTGLFGGHKGTIKTVRKSPRGCQSFSRTVIPCI